MGRITETHHEVFIVTMVTVYATEETTILMDVKSELNLALMGL